MKSDRSGPNPPLPLHSWNVTTQEAILIQEALKERIIPKKTFSRVRTIGGGDVAYLEDGNLAIGAIVILSFPNMELLETATADGNVSFPYIPGLLSFREGPILIKAFQKLKSKPDVMIFEGQGIAHPRGIGLASHMGLWLDTPSIGCAKTPLLDEFISPGPLRGNFEWIRRGGEKVGVVLTTREKVKPLFVSPGHRINLPTSVQLILGSCRRFRLPEPLRKAHQLAERVAHGSARNLKPGGSSPL